jgi:hypothetical protein
MLFPMARPSARQHHEARQSRGEASLKITTERRDALGAACFISMAALAAPGCASHPVPVIQIQASTAAVARAQAFGATDGLVLAREKLALSARWVAARDPEPARWLAEQAEVDAELARARSASARALREAASLEGQLRLVRTGGLS